MQLKESEMKICVMHLIEADGLVYIEEGYITIETQFGIDVTAYSYDSDCLDEYECTFRFYKLPGQDKYRQPDCFRKTGTTI